MDRISDSGSDGLGSNPDGSTKNAFIGIYRPYRGKKTGKVLHKTLPVLILWCFKSLAVPRETIDIEHMIWKGRIPCTPAGRTMRHAGAILSTLYAAGQSGQSSGNLVPWKRFRRNQMNSAKCFVPRKRFIRDKTAILRTNMPLADTTFPWEPGKLTSLEYVNNPEHAKWISFWADYLPRSCIFIKFTGARIKSDNDRQ